MTALPFAEWLPDQPDYANPGASFIRNVVPLTKESYGPMPTPMVYSGALTARCQGAYSFVDKTGAANIFAGDATKLYRLTSGSAPNFSDVSRLAGGAYTTGSPVNPTTPTIAFWSMTAFGERIIATNYSDDIQTLLVGTDANFSQLAAAAPKARFAAVIRDFLMVGNTTDPTFGAQPRRLWWPAIGNPTSWPTPGTNAAIQVQSDYQDLEQADLGQVVGLIGGHLAAADGAAFCERGIYRIDYVGSSAGIFSFKVAEGAAGTQSPLSIVPSRVLGSTGVALYLGEDGFFAFDGTQTIAIGFGKIDRTVLHELDPAYLSAVLGIADPKLPLVYWLYNAGTQGALYDRLLVYNTVLGRWALCDLSATPAEWLLRSVHLGRTLDSLDSFGSLDAVPAPLGSGYWQGNQPELSIFDNAHKLNFMTGAAMAPTVETSETELAPGRRAWIRSARPLCDGGAPSIAIGTRNRLIDSVVFQAAIPVNVIGECPQRVTGRYVRARLTLPAASVFTHLQGVDLTARAEGIR